MPRTTAHNHLDFKQQYANYMHDLRKAAEKRDLTLGLDLDSLEVHEVTAVSFKTTDFKVTRHTLSGRALQAMTPGLPEQDIDYSNLL